MATLEKTFKVHNFTESGVKVKISTTMKSDDNEELAIKGSWDDWEEEIVLKHAYNHHLQEYEHIAVL